MAHASPAAGATVYIDDDILMPEDTYTPDGWPTTVRFVGPGLLLETIDPDQ